MRLKPESIKPVRLTAYAKGQKSCSTTFYETTPSELLRRIKQAFSEDTQRQGQRRTEKVNA